MALEVEDGTGKSTAESYISIADVGIYHSNRGNTAWEAIGTDALKEAALRKATDYMTANYRDRWQGCRKTKEQALCWPRYGVVVDGYAVENDIVPEPVRRACAELALKASADELQPDLTKDVLSETVGPISVTYDKNSPQATKYKLIEAMLAPYFEGGGEISIGLVRV